MPVPPGPWDDCFTGVRWPMAIAWPGILTLRISADVDFAVVYDERAEAFCVEPQTGPPDGPNTASPGRFTVISVAVRVPAPSPGDVTVIVHWPLAFVEAT